MLESILQSVGRTPLVKLRRLNEGLQATDRQTFCTRPHERAVDFQAGRVAQGFKAGGGIVEVHKA